MIYQSMSRKWQEEMLRGSFPKERSIRILEEYFFIVIEDFRTFASAWCRGGMEWNCAWSNSPVPACLQTRGVFITGCRAECVPKWTKVSSGHPTRPITLRHSVPSTQAQREGCGESQKLERRRSCTACGGQLQTCFPSKRSKTSNRRPPAPTILIQ